MFECLATMNQRRGTTGNLVTKFGGFGPSGTNRD